jgi:modulator of FtsH protease HflK
MAWNQPGGNSNSPWGRRPGKDGQNVDEAFKNFQRKLESLIKGGGSGAGGSNGGPDSGGDGATMDRGAIWAVLAVIVAFWAYQSTFQIGQAENGVVQRFGRFVDIRNPGLGFHFWPVERMTKVNTKEVNSLDYKSRVLTQDINLIDMQITVQYQLKDPRAYLFQVRDPKQTLREVSESAIREVVGRSSLESIFVSGRQQVTQRTRELIQRTLDQYNTGIAVSSVNLTDIQVPEAVIPSQRDANKALADQDRLKKEAEAYASGILPRAEGAAQKRVLDAEAYRAQVVAVAEGEASRFSQLVGAYEAAPRVTRERLYLEAVETVMNRSRKVIVDSKGGGGQMLYLPLDKLVERAAGSREADSTAAKPPGPVAGEAEITATPEARARGER